MFVYIPLLSDEFELKTDGFKVIATLTTQRNAIKMLHDRVTIILEYLNQLNLGTVEKDQETLRQIGSLITSIPALNSVDFQSEFMTVSNAHAVSVGMNC